MADEEDSRTNEVEKCSKFSNRSQQLGKMRNCEQSRNGII